MAEPTKTQRDNRWHVQAKLDMATYVTFTSWCKKNDFSYSSGIRKLLQTHPMIQAHVSDTACT